VGASLSFPLLPFYSSEHGRLERSSESVFSSGRCFKDFKVFGFLSRRIKLVLFFSDFSFIILFLFGRKRLVAGVFKGGEMRYKNESSARHFPV